MACQVCVCVCFCTVHLCTSAREDQGEVERRLRCDAMFLLSSAVRIFFPAKCHPSARVCRFSPFFAGKWHTPACLPTTLTDWCLFFRRHFDFLFFSILVSLFSFFSIFTSQIITQIIIEANSLAHTHTKASRQTGQNRHLLENDALEWSFPPPTSFPPHSFTLNNLPFLILTDALKMRFFGRARGTRLNGQIVLRCSIIILAIENKETVLGQFTYQTISTSAQP